MIPFSTQRFAEEWTAKITSALNRTDVKAEITPAAKKWSMLSIIANLEASVAVLVKVERDAAIAEAKKRRKEKEPVKQPMVTLTEGDLPPVLPGSVSPVDPEVAGLPPLAGGYADVPGAAPPPAAPRQSAPESEPDAAPGGAAR